MLKMEEILDLTHSIAADIFEGKTYPWEVLEDISAFIVEKGKTLSSEAFDSPKEGVWIAKDAVVAPTAYIGTPCIIDHKAEVRHGAYIRGNAIVGKRCVVGNSVELKNVVLFDEVQVPHYNYVGDSILGYQSHMGAGSITSNVKSDRSHVSIKSGADVIDTGRKKVGAILGDQVEIGCNSVLNPGTVIGKNSVVYPLSSVRGVIPDHTIYKNEKNIMKKEQR